MKLVKTLIKTALLLSLMTMLIAQGNNKRWAEMMEDPNSNFYKIQKEFGDYWKGKEIKRGSGWKQFKRWEYFMGPRVYPSGSIPSPDFVHRSMNEFRQMSQTSLFKTTNSSDWSNIGPFQMENISYSPGIGRINVIAVDPSNPSVIYAGAPAGGLWKSTDGGNNWVCKTDNLDVLGVSGIAIDPNNSSVVYIATGDGDAGDTYSIGVLKSTDGGENFSQTGLNWEVSSAQRISKLLIHPTNSNVLFVAAGNGVYKSEDAGATWYSKIDGLFKDIEFKPGDPNTVYAAGYYALYKSTDGGNNFTQVTNGLPSTSEVRRIAIAVTPANPNLVYLVAGNTSSTFKGFYKSTNSGSSFTTQATSPNIFGYATNGNDTEGQAWYDMTIAADPNDENRVFVGTINLWETFNGGQSWQINTHWNFDTQSVQFLHCDFHELMFAGNTLFAGTDGGIHRTTNLAQSWTDLSEGIVNTQFYKFTISPTNQNYLIGGAQDNGTLRYDANVFTHVYGADGGETIIDYSNENVVFASYQNGVLLKSTDRGENFSNIGSNISEYGAWITPYVMDPVDHNTLYAGYVSVWKSTDNGNSWRKTSRLSGNTINSIVVCQANNNYVFVSKAASEGKPSIVYKSANKGKNWTNITSNLPVSTAAVTSVSVSKTDPNHLWVTLSGYSSGEKVYESTNGGSSWTNISGTLPNIPVNCITSGDGSDPEVFVGTDAGVFYRANSSSGWAAFDSGLPNVIINELEIHNSTGQLFAASFGRGIWKSPMPNATNQVPPVAVINGPYNGNVNESITFSSAGSADSDGQIVSYHWNFGDGSTSTELNPQHTYTVGGVFNATLFVVDNDGLSSPVVNTDVTITGDPGGEFITYESEPNDSDFESNGPAAIGKDITGTVSSSSDVDWFYIDFSETGEHEISILSASNGDLDWWLYKSGDLNNYIARGYTSNNPDVMTFTIEQMGRYYIKVSGYNGATDDYTLSISQNQVNNFITSETEQNGSAAKANGPMGFGTTVNATLDRSSDQDYFYFDVVNPGNININLQFNNVADGTWLLYHESDTRNYVAYASSTNPHTGNYNATQTGRYYIQVYMWGGTAGSYTLDIGTGTPKRLNINEIADDNTLDEIPTVFKLNDAYPNPFNPSTNLSFSLPQASKVRLTIFNSVGEIVNKVVDGKMLAEGTYTYIWNGTNQENQKVSSGIYFYTLDAERYRETKKLILMK